MNKFFKKLVKYDCEIKTYVSHQEIIKQGLAPLLALNNKTTNVQKANLLEQSKYLNWQEKAAKIFNQLDKNHIEFLVFKGFAYTFLLYDNSHIRPYSDIDIYVHESNYLKSETLLLALGFTKMQSRQGKYISFQNSFYDNNILQTTIDLHWQINNRIEIQPHFPFDSLYQGAVNIVSADFNFKTLNPTDAFILASFHYQAHRPNDRKHIWLYDLALMWHSMDTNTQNKCIEMAKHRQQFKIVNAILNQLNHTFVGCIETNIEKLEIFEVTQDYLKNRPKKLTDIRIRLNNIKGFGRKLKYLSEYIFQSKSYVQNRYKTKSKVWVYFYYPRMWIEDFIKLFRG